MQLAYVPADATATHCLLLQIGFAFLVPAHLGGPGERAVKRVCVCDIDSDVCYCAVQFEYQQAQLEAEVENLSWKVERAEITDRGVSSCILLYLIISNAKHRLALSSVSSLTLLVWWQDKPRVGAMNVYEMTYFGWSGMQNLLQ